MENKEKCGKCNVELQEKEVRDLHFLGIPVKEKMVYCPKCGKNEYITIYNNNEKKNNTK